MKALIIILGLGVSFSLGAQSKSRIVTYDLRTKPELPFPIGTDSISKKILDAVLYEKMEVFAFDSTNNRLFKTEAEFIARKLHKYHNQLVGMMPFDQWKIGLTYLKSDIVRYKLKAYLALRDSKGSTETNPEQNKRYWEALNVPYATHHTDLGELLVEWIEGQPVWLHFIWVIDSVNTSIDKEITYRRKYAFSIKFSDFKKVILQD